MDALGTTSSSASSSSSLPLVLTFTRLLASLPFNLQSFNTPCFAYFILYSFLLQASIYSSRQIFLSHTTTQHTCQLWVPTAKTTAAATTKPPTTVATTCPRHSTPAIRSPEHLLPNSHHLNRLQLQLLPPHKHRLRHHRHRQRLPIPRLHHHPRLCGHTGSTCGKQKTD